MTIHANFLQQIEKKASFSKEAKIVISAMVHIDPKVRWPFLQNAAKDAGIENYSCKPLEDFYKGESCKEIKQGEVSLDNLPSDNVKIRKD